MLFLASFVEMLFFGKNFVNIFLGEKMRIDYIINEMIKKVEMASIYAEDLKIKDLDNKDENRL